MTTALARTTLTRFLTDRAATAIALTGPWGSGKTWLWNDVVRRVAGEEKPPFARYAYVSLFGLNSMTELKAAIFENAVPPDAVRTGATPESLVTELKAVFKEDTAAGTAWNLGSLAFWQTRRHAQSLANFLPVWGSAVRSAAFLAVRDYVICIDDIERKGKDLSITDVLGLVSYLREQRNCRIILILNEEGLGKAGMDERDKFTGFREKVLEREVVFHPTPEECVDIVFKDASDMQAMAASSARTLGITNIRVLQRLSRVLKDFSPALATARPTVQKSVAHAATLLVWCHYGEAAGAPGYAFTKKALLSHFADVMDVNKLPPDEASWMAILWDYGVHLHDALVVEVCNYLERGNLDEGAVAAAVAEANAKADREAASGSMQEAWKLLHDSFTDNADDFVEVLEKTATANASWIFFAEAESVCVVLRKLGENDRADRFAKEWVRINAAIDPKRLEVPEDFLERREEDTVFREEAAHFVRPGHRPTLEETIREQVDKSGWNPIDIEVLSTATVDEYVAFFLGVGADEALSRYVHALLRFARIKSPQADYLKIAQTASDALRVLASYSPINQLRVAKFPLYSPPNAAPAAPPPANPFAPSP